MLKICRKKFSILDQNDIVRKVNFSYSKKVYDKKSFSLNFIFYIWVINIFKG